MPKIDISKKAQKSLSLLPEKHSKQVAKKLLLLKDNAAAGKSLKGEARDYMSLASGEYRIIYFLDVDTVKVVLIEKRNDERVYKQLSRKP